MSPPGRPKDPYRSAQHQGTPVSDLHEHPHGSDPSDALHTLAGEYVLGVLDETGRHDVVQRLPHDADLRAAVTYWEDRLLPLTALALPQEPSPDLWRRIESNLPAAPARAPGPAARQPAAARSTTPRGNDGSSAGGWNSLALWRGLSALSLAAVVLMGAWLLLDLAAPPADRYLVVLATPDGARPGWVVQSGSARELVLTPLADTAVPPQRALQFWTKADDWEAPVSLGLVAPGQALTVSLDRLPPLQPNQLFEITLEPETGSPTGRPTGPILYIGRAIRSI